MLNTEALFDGPISALAREATSFAWLCLAKQIPFKEIQLIVLDKQPLEAVSLEHSDCWIVASLLLVIDVRVWT